MFPTAIYSYWSTYCNDETQWHLFDPGHALSLSNYSKARVCVFCVHRAKEATLLLVASDLGRLYVFALQPLDATHSCQLLNEFQLCSPAEMLVLH